MSRREKCETCGLAVADCEFGGYHPPDVVEIATDQMLDAVHDLGREPHEYLRWPWRELDALYGGMAPGTVHYVVAFSGMGKTTFITSAILEWQAERIMLDVMPLEIPPRTWRAYVACQSIGIDPGLMLSGDYMAREDVAELRERVKKALIAQTSREVVHFVHVHETPVVNVAALRAAAQLAAANNPEIMKCTPASIVLSVAKIMQWGLEIGETAHIVPFNVNVAPKGAPKQWEKRATAIADYKGLAQLMIASRCVRHVEAFCVYENDLFEYQQGSEARLWHTPTSDRKARGALKGAYVVLHLPFGVKAFDYMSIEDIDEIRQKHSKQWKDGPCPTWYAKKTVVRQASKLVPKDPRLAKAFAVLEEDVREEFGGVPALAPDDDDEIPGVPAQPQLASGEVREMGEEWTEEGEQAELLPESEPEAKPYEMD